MKIIRNDNKLVNLYELKVGNLFEIYPNGRVFILTDKIQDNNLLVVDLQNGEGYYISKETTVIKVDGTLYIEEIKKYET